MADDISVVVVSQPIAVTATGPGAASVNVGAETVAVTVAGGRGPEGPPGSNSFSRGVAILNPTGAVNLVSWRAPFACTVTNVRGYRAGGSGAVVNAAKAGGGAHLAASLSLTAAGQWIDGGAVQNAAYAAGDTLTFALESVAGGPSQVSIQVEFSRSPT